MKTLLATTFAFIFLIGASISSVANAADPIQTSYFSDKAVSGYDTVAYFTQNEAVKGKKKFVYKWQGATWLFSSQENLDLFKANPTSYAPQYGGYCSWAAAENSLAPGDAQQWHIDDGKLYLNYNADIKKTWLSDKDAFIKKANMHFPNLIK